jgi:Leucine-rich repeat (LRR) protein
MFKDKLIFVSIVSLLIVYNLGAQITQIPDVKFEKALIDLKIDSDGVINGQVLTSNVQTLTSLDVSAKDIINLTGIQDFASLEELYCQNNLLQSINISENKELQILNCSSNMISDLSVRDNLKLKTLNFGSNAIGEINVSDNADLEELYVDKNELSTLNVKNNPKLTALNCSYNQLSILNITYNWNLEYLDFSFNNLDLISLINGVNLEYLDVSSNPLTSLNLISLPALKTIRIVDNDLLSIIYFDSNPNLEYISCHDNEILGTIKLQDTDALTYLNCSNNDLTELITSQSPLLESLYCQNNKISRLDLSLNTELAFLKCNDNDLEYLNLRNGQNSLMTGGDTEYEGVITYIEGVNALNNPLLQCIDVDNESVANAGTSPYDSWLIDDDASFSENCQSYLGVEDYQTKNSVNLYPNPSRDFISITSNNESIVDVMIYSVIGNETVKINRNFSLIPVNKLANGIYFIKVTMENRIVFKRLIKV